MTASIEDAAPERGGAAVASGRPSSRLRIATVLFFLALFSIPVIPAVIGVATPAGTYPVLDGVPDRATGAYLSVAGPEAGYVKLFPWVSPPDVVPAETPSIEASQLRVIVVAQKARAETDRYYLYRVDTREPVAVSTSGVDRRRLEMTVVGPLTPGDYLLDVSDAAGFVGRQYYFFTVR